VYDELLVTNSMLNNSWKPGVQGLECDFQDIRGVKTWTPPLSVYLLCIDMFVFIISLYKTWLQKKIFIKNSFDTTFNHL